MWICPHDLQEISNHDMLTHVLIPWVWLQLYSCLEHTPRGFLPKAVGTKGKEVKPISKMIDHTRSKFEPARVPNLRGLLSFSE